MRGAKKDVDLVLRKLLDVNVLAIFLVEDHPGSPYVDPVVSEGLAGGYRLLVPDQLPLRARWVLRELMDRQENKGRQGRLARVFPSARS